MRSQVVASLLLVCLASVAQSSHTDRDEPDTEETIEQDRLLLEEWERMSNSVYDKDGRAKEPAETLELLRSMLEIEGRFSPKTMAKRREIRDKTEKLIAKSQVSNLKCTNLFYHIELNYLIHDNLNNNLNVLPYLNHCKFEQFIACKDFWSSKLRSIVDRIDAKDKGMVEEMVRSIRSTIDSGENHYHHVQIPLANIKQGLLDYARHLEASDGLNFTEVRQTVRHVTGAVKMKLDEMTDIYNQYVCDEQYARQMDQFTIDWSITGNICRVISRMLEFLLNEKHSGDDAIRGARDHGLQAHECWWLTN